MTNSSLRERLLRINQDYSNFRRDSQLWNDLMNNSSRPVQWDGYNLSGTFNKNIAFLFLLKNVVFVLGIVTSWYQFIHTEVMYWFQDVCYCNNNLICRCSLKEVSNPSVPEFLILFLFVITVVFELVLWCSIYFKAMSSLSFPGLDNVQAMPVCLNNILVSLNTTLVYLQVA